MSTDHAKEITDLMEEHREIPAHDGPGYCRGCEWESRRIGISSTLQHRSHLGDVIARFVREREEEVRQETVQAVRNAAEHEPPQVDEYGRTELEGYLTITDADMAKIAAGGDGMDWVRLTATEYGELMETANPSRLRFDPALVPVPPPVRTIDNLRGKE